MAGLVRQATILTELRSHGVALALDRTGRIRAWPADGVALDEAEVLLRARDPIARELLRDVAWRTAVMRKQARGRGALPFLMARPGKHPSVGARPVATPLDRARGIGVGRAPRRLLPSSTPSRQPRLQVRPQASETTRDGESVGTSRPDGGRSGTPYEGQPESAPCGPPARLLQQSSRPRRPLPLPALRWGGRRRGERSPVSRRLAVPGRPTLVPMASLPSRRPAGGLATRQPEGHRTEGLTSSAAAPVSAPASTAAEVTDEVTLLRLATWLADVAVEAAHAAPEPGASAAGGSRGVGRSDAAVDGPGAQRAR